MGGRKREGVPQSWGISPRKTMRLQFCDPPGGESKGLREGCFCHSMFMGRRKGGVVGHRALPSSQEVLLDGVAPEDWSLVSGVAHPCPHPPTLTHPTCGGWNQTSQKHMFDHISSKPMLTPSYLLSAT